ncbi:MAG: hypothetical protein Ta2D_08010 [Rickettsiales bacterium]|nr:MAG: hypothetical protein Ta2D_08010 [Rickettsiales bacterium]
MTEIKKPLPIIFEHIEELRESPFHAKIASKLKEKGLIITKFIASGGAGTVFEARNEKGEVFAVKLPKNNQPVFKEALRGDINSSNFIRKKMSEKKQKLFTLGQTEEEAEIQPFDKYLQKRVFIMKKQESDLGNLIKNSHNFFSNNEAKKNIQQMTNMMHALHKKDKVAPDFKLANILYDKKEKNIQLADLDSITSEGKKTYTYTYVTPELANSTNWTERGAGRINESHTKKSDSFLLGLSILASLKVDPLLLSMFNWRNIYSSKSTYSDHVAQAKTKLFEYSKTLGYDDKTATKISQLLEYDPKKRTSVESLSLLFKDNEVSQEILKPKAQQLSPKQEENLQKLRVKHNKIIKQNSIPEGSYTKYEKELISLEEKRIKEDSKNKIANLKKSARKELGLVGYYFFTKAPLNLETKRKVREAKNLRDVELQNFKDKLIRNRKVVVEENVKVNTTDKEPTNSKVLNITADRILKESSKALGIEQPEGKKI